MSTPNQSALLVIDVQREYFDGALPITHPTGHLEQILDVVDTARDVGMPTAFVQHHQPDPESPIFRKDSEMWQLHPEIQKRPHDLLLQKSLPGSFTDTCLEDWLKEREIKSVCIAGYMTHMCCDTTARQAFHRGYQVQFLSDATGTLTIENEAGSASAEQMQQSILVAQQMFISQVISSQQW
ncbi:MAG: cysteine hydrolase family protein, partial [Planctomycetota bacterium]